MNKLTSKILCLLFLLSIAQVSNAQKLKDFIKKTTEGIEDGISDVVAQALADKIVEKAVLSLEGKIDTLLDLAFKEDSLSSANSGETRSYADFLAGINETDDVEEQYDFDISFDLLNVDQKGKETNEKHYFRSDGAYFGLESENSLIILDSKNGIIVSYDLKDKKAFAFGKSMMQYASAMAASQLSYDFDITKTNETKKVLGYNCIKYTGHTEDSTFETYISPDFPINLFDAYINISESFFNESVSQSFKDVKGMALESVSTYEDGKVLTSTVTRVNNTTSSFKKSDFNFGIE